jgi:hypothetical protein
MKKKWFVRFVLVLFMAVLIGSSDSAFAQGANIVTLEGSFVLNKTENPGHCAWAPPPSISGKITMTVDLTAGTVNGDLVGHGAGDVNVQPFSQCGQYVAIYTAQADISGKISGSVDRKTGTITAQALVDSKGTGKQVMVPGRRCFLGNYSEASECPYSWNASSPQKVSVSGVVKNDGSASGEIVCSAPECILKRCWWGYQEYPTVKAPPGCSTNGTWTAKGPAWGTTANHPPNIVQLSYTPDFPEDTDVVTITVEANDPDGDKLTYSWTLDGTKMPATGSTVTYSKPSVGDHVVVVTVSDPGGLKATKTLPLTVTGHMASVDSDGDGLDDDRDLCPQESSKNKDGCPDFKVTLGCQPKPPAVNQSVSCTAPVAGKHKDNTLEFAWFLDSQAVQRSGSSTWTWNQAQTGYHTVQVIAMTQEHTQDATVPLDVGAPAQFAAHIAMSPDPPVPDQSVTLKANVTGALAGEKLTYQWTVDGAPVCSEEVCLVQAATGTHTVTLVVKGTSREASDTRTFDVLTAVSDTNVTKAGFNIDNLSCTSNITSDEKLVCSAHVARLRKDVELLNVVWLIDGRAVQPTTSLDTSFSFTLPQPPPGDHRVEFRATDPKTGYSRSDSTSVNVSAGANAAIPPIAQTAAAAGTLTALGAWLWLEYGLRKRAAAREAAEVTAARADETPRQVPSWVNDPRSLEQIWNEEDAEDARRRGLAHSARDEWEKKQQALGDQWTRTRESLLEEWRKRDQIGDTFRRARTEQLVDFMDRHVGNAFKDGVWDEQKFGELMDNLRRFGLKQSQADFGSSESALAIDEARQAHRREFGTIWAGAVTAAVGGGAIMAAATSANEVAMLGLIGLGGKVVAGAAGGAVEGGVSGALSGALHATPVVKTAASLLSKDAWWQTGLSALEDLGDVVTLGHGSKLLSQLGKSGVTSLDKVQLPKMSSRVAGGGEAMPEGTSSSVSRIGDEIKATGAGQKGSGLEKQVGDQVAAAARKATELQERITDLVKRKDQLEELKGLEEKARAAYAQYVTKTPLTYPNSPYTNEKEELRAVGIELMAAKKYLSGLKQTANPSSSTLEEITRLKSDIRELEQERKELHEVIDNALCRFYRVKSPDQVTNDVVQRHFDDHMRKALGNDGPERLRTLLNDRTVNAGGTTTTAQLEAIDKKIKDMTQDMVSARAEAFGDAPKQPTIGPAPRPNIGIGHQTMSGNPPKELDADPST